MGTENLVELVTRIAFNSKKWRHPTGEAAGQEQRKTYNALHGFGHEDWLFRDEWVIDGWRYAFIQGVNKSRRRLIKLRQPFNLTVFTVQPDRQRRYVARIREAEVLDNEQAEAALATFRSMGWLEEMLAEIRKVDGNEAAS